MDGIERDHIVEFDKWCIKCANKDLSESEDPCWDCLNEGVALNGQPINYKPKE